ncbi:MAG: integrating conjugative element protein [Pseudomonas sp.]|nr:integrating conjugative element protein [Pseudomonas sp.]
MNIKTPHTTLKLLAIAVLLATSTLTTASHAFDIRERPYEKVSGTAVNDKLSYELGGGAAYGAASTRIVPPGIGFGIQWKADMMCGNMDLQSTIKNQLNGSTDGFKSIMGGIVESATGAIMSLPAMLIQRSNPGLYELLSNGVLQARVDFDRSKMSCQAILDQAGSYLDGGPSVASLAKAEAMKSAIRATDGDSVAAEKKAEADGTENGIEWMGEKRGGAGQKPIAFTEDITRRAYNTTVGRTSNTNAMVTAAQCNGAAICTLWSSPQIAAEFAKKVVGETELATCQDGCDPSVVKPGTGLLHLADEVYEEKAEIMLKLLDKTQKISEEELRKLSTPMLPVSRSVIEALRDDPDGQVLSQRLLSEISLADIIWKGMQLMRLLMTGAQNPDVQKVAEAKQHVSDKIANLQAEIDSMKMEMDMRRDLASNTATAALNRAAAARAQSGFVLEADASPDRIQQAEKGQEATQ